ncbi:hypothetical protein KC315_g2040 [Hortaea werneckii]|nr:hypothetical protein KC315_g2040 [Hortaea werneckii]
MSHVPHSQSSSYADSGFSNRMGWGKRPALLIIDVCWAYWDSSSPLDISQNPAAAASPDSMRRLLDVARQAGIPVAHTKVAYHDPEMRDAGLFWLKAKPLSVWQKDDPRGLAADLDGLQPKPEDIVVYKKYPSAFFGTTLATELILRQIDTLVICGVSTSGCVRASALDAMCYGFRPMVVDEACGDRTPEIHASNLFDLNAKYADVVTESEAKQKMLEAHS